MNTRSTVRLFAAVSLIGLPFLAILGRCCPAMAQCHLQGGATANISRSLPTILRSSGDAQLDDRVSTVLRDVEQAFGLRPDFGYIDDSGGMNAYATVDDRIGSSSDHCVLFGVNMLQTLTEGELAESPSILGLMPSGAKVPNLSIRAVLAHEFGHLLQFKNGVIASGPVIELQADFVAGWHLNHHVGKFGNEDLAQEAVSRVIGRFYGIGDRLFNNPSHHGTPHERIEAFMAGMEAQAATSQDAYRAAVAYLDQHPPQDPSQVGRLPVPRGGSDQPTTTIVLVNQLVMTPIGPRIVQVPVTVAVPSPEEQAREQERAAEQQRLADLATIKLAPQKIAELENRLASAGALGRFGARLSLDSWRTRYAQAQARIESRGGGPGRRPDGD